LVRTVHAAGLIPRTTTLAMDVVSAAPFRGSGMMT
jgi:hypothetical protein